jgi:hypothetical protein
MLIIAGATGHVGSGILAYLLSLPEHQRDRIIILSRRPVEMAEGKPNVEVILHEDFSSYPSELLNRLKDARGVIWAMGISQNGIAREKYVRTTHTCTIATAEAFSRVSENLNFVYVSAEGTTTKPGKFTPLFSRVKGETEEALLRATEKIPSLQAYSVRLGFIDHRENAEALRYCNITRKRLSLRIIDKVLTPAVRRLWPNMHTPIVEVGKVLLELAEGDGELLEGDGVIGGGRTLRNFGLRRLAGLKYKP